MDKLLCIVGYIITKNESSTIHRAVTSLLSVTPHVLVVDSESGDDTREIASGLGADVRVHPFLGFSTQRNWALDYIDSHYQADYVLSIDADEWLSDDLARAIQERAMHGSLGDRDVYLLDRLIRFDGRILRWGGFGHTRLPRLFRLDAGRYEHRAVNEHLALRPTATIGRLPGVLVNEDVDSWEGYIEKHNRYSTLEAEARVHVALGRVERLPMREALRRPHLRRRWLRQHIWDRVPARPAIRFVQIYLLAGGIFDGRAGFHRALFEAWQEMCTDLKAEALVREFSTLTDS
jgi:glycosyltransferase involved in cell wall biosynthesis